MDSHVHVRVRLRVRGRRLLERTRMTQLTEARIRAAKPKGKPYKLRDSRGLYLLVTPPGGRLWRLRYRHAGCCAPSKRAAGGRKIGETLLVTQRFGL